MSQQALTKAQERADDTSRKMVGEIAADMQKIRECVLDCGKAIIANNAKIELLREQVCAAVAEVATMGVADMRSRLNEMVTRSDTRLTESLASMNDAVKDMMNSQRKSVEQGLERLSSFSQRQADTHASQLQNLSRFLEEAVTTLTRQHKEHKKDLAQQMENLTAKLDDFVTKMDKTQADFQESVSRSIEALARSVGNLTKLLVALLLGCIGGFVYLIFFR